MWRTIIGSFFAVIVVLSLSTNAVFMIISPKTWFRLPSWIRANGTLTEKTYGSGWGAVQVRVLGAIMLTVITWIAFHIFSK